MWRVVYNSPILIEAFFARPWRSARHSAWSSSDQIGGTEATRDPRRPKGLVMVTQGHGEHPAAASRRRTLGKKFTTTNVPGAAIARGARRARDGVADLRPGARQRPSNAILTPSPPAYPPSSAISRGHGLAAAKKLRPLTFLLNLKPPLKNAVSHQY